MRDFTVYYADPQMSAVLKPCLSCGQPITMGTKYLIIDGQTFCDPEHYAQWLVYEKFPPQPDEPGANLWLAEMGYATYHRLMVEGKFWPPTRSTLEDLPDGVQRAWLAAAAAIRRRVVQWGLSAEEEGAGA